MSTYTLTIPAPAEFITANQRHHWAERARLTRAWRNAALIYARQAHLPHLQKAHIVATVHKTHRRPYDAHNLVLTAKACVDGLVTGKGRVKGYGLLPDDSNDHLIGPDMRAGEPRDTPCLVLTITDLGDTTP